MTEQPGTFQRATVAEAAAQLGVSPTTVRRMVKRGQLVGERVHRPQGSAFVVVLPDSGSHAADDAAPTRQDAAGVARSHASPAGQLAAWSETFLTPLVAVIERQADRIAELERENGRLSERLAAPRPENSPLDASTATPASAVTRQPFTLRRRSWAVYGALGILAVVVPILAWALLAVPR